MSPLASSAALSFPLFSSLAFFTSASSFSLAFFASASLASSSSFALAAAAAASSLACLSALTRPDKHKSGFLFFFFDIGIRFSATSAGDMSVSSSSC
uniref:Uncharacterized protein n=1 Tax=Triticum urartu TaxID=4572 RepID=A0A8R7UAV7_TRIUA